MFSNLDNIRPALKSLVAALREDYPYASVLAVEDAWRRWSVSRQGVSIDASGFGGGTGFVVRVFDGVGCAEYSFNQFSEERIPKIKALISERLAAQNKALGDIDPLPTPFPADEPFQSGAIISWTPGSWGTRPSYRSSALSGRRPSSWTSA